MSDDKGRTGIPNPFEADDEPQGISLLLQRENEDRENIFRLQQEVVALAVSLRKATDERERGLEIQQKFFALQRSFVELEQNLHTNFGDSYPLLRFITCMLAGGLGVFIFYTSFGAYCGPIPAHAVSISCLVLGFVLYFSGLGHFLTASRTVMIRREDESRASSRSTGTIQ